MKNKLKDNSGSAMIVSIFCIIIVSILGMYMTTQIANQLKSSKSTYENMQVLYLAESSIEKTIYDLENQICNKIKNKSRDDIDLYSGEWINVDHTKHENTKVTYIGEKVTHESFEQLIFKELLNTNGSKDTFWILHSQVIADMQIIDQSTSNNFKIITDRVWQLGGYLISSAYNSEENLKVFIDSINESINQLNYANKIYESKLPDIKAQQAIERSNRLKGVFEEILCRLGVFKGESNVVENIPINIKLYSRTMNTEGDITKEEFKTIDKDIEGKDLVVKFIYKENKLNDIDFDKLNEVLDNGIYGQGILKNNSVSKIEDAKKIYKIRFDFNNKRVNYSITNIENK